MSDKNYKASLFDASQINVQSILDSLSLTDEEIDRWFETGSGIVTYGIELHKKERIEEICNLGNQFSKAITHNTKPSLGQIELIRKIREVVLLAYSSICCEILEDNK